MKKSVLLGLSVAFGIGVSAPLWATEPGQADAVRAYVSDVDERIAQMQTSAESAQYGAYYCISLNVNPHHRPWPAVGIYELEYTFYFDKEDGAGGQREPKAYPDRLVKATCLRRVSDQTLKQQFWYMNDQPVMRQTELAGQTVDLLLFDSHSRAVREAQKEAGEILKTFRTILTVP